MVEGSGVLPVTITWLTSLSTPESKQLRVGSLTPLAFKQPPEAAIAWNMSPVKGSGLQFVIGVSTVPVALHAG